nr:MAG TPA: hypothetical protein [Bacteriophage sp.]
MCNRGAAFDPVFPAYGFSGNPEKLQLGRFLLTLTT